MHIASKCHFGGLLGHVSLEWPRRLHIALDLISVTSVTCIYMLIWPMLPWHDSHVGGGLPSIDCAVSLAKVKYRPIFECCIRVVNLKPKCLFEPNFFYWIVPHQYNDMRVSWDGRRRLENPPRGLPALLVDSDMIDRPGIHEGANIFFWK